MKAPRPRSSSPGMIVAGQPAPATTRRPAEHRPPRCDGERRQRREEEDGEEDDAVHERVRGAVERDEHVVEVEEPPPRPARDPADRPRPRHVERDRPGDDQRRATHRRAASGASAAAPGRLRARSSAASARCPPDGSSSRAQFQAKRSPMPNEKTAVLAMCRVRLLEAAQFRGEVVALPDRRDGHARRRGAAAGPGRGQAAPPLRRSSPSRRGRERSAAGRAPAREAHPSAARRGRP